MQKIKVVIIDQSVSVCKELTSIVSKHKNITVVGTATDLDEGLNIILTASPHVVLLDVNIEANTNKTALDTIIETKFLPIIILSENSVKQTAKTVYAISHGAVDFIKKLNGNKQQNKQRYNQDIIAKIMEANYVNTARSLLYKDQKVMNKINVLPAKENKKDRQMKQEKRTSLIAIGTSTGGPRALQRILEDIPKGFSVPILIVQHMPARFTKSLASRLNNINNIRVKEASHDEVIEAETAYIAPGNYHMLVKQAGKKLKIMLNQEAEYFGHRPSVNVLFESVAQLSNIHKIAVVLTGMGKDGTEGALKISQSDYDSVIIAESKETAVIDGMPNAVIESNCVTEIIKLNEIAQALVDYSK